MKTQTLQAIKVLLIMTIGFGFMYPVAITIASQILFPQQANGSLIYKNNQIIGSILIAQKTTSPKYFWPRPSASDHTTLPSGASNLSLSSQKLKEQVLERKQQGAAFDTLYTSASGLDPHISKDAAISQVPRVIKARNLNDNQKGEVLAILESFVEKRQFGFLGEERINVLKLNLAIDAAFEPK